MTAVHADQPGPCYGDAAFTATVRVVSEDEVRHLDSALPKEVTVDRSVYTVEQIASKGASALVVRHHYLHRRPPVSYAYGLFRNGVVVGAVTFGVPASRHLQMGACPSDPQKVLELNRLWVHDDEPKNTESWFVSRALGKLPPRIVVSYADPVHGHYGYVYRALNFKYAGWTDMERKTPRYDYLPADPSTHTRDAWRNGWVERRRRIAKVKYWIVTGNRTERRALTALCGWPQLDWITAPPPKPPVAGED